MYIPDRRLFLISTPTFVIYFYSIHLIWNVHLHILLLISAPFFLVSLIWRGILFLLLKSVTSPNELKAMYSLTQFTATLS